MTYRDDRNALVDRVAALEEKLSEARSRADRADGLQREIDANHRELEALRRKLAKALPAGALPPSAPGNRGPIVAASLGLVILAGIGVGIFSVRSAAPARAAAPPECDGYFAAVDRCAAVNPSIGKPLQQAAAQQRVQWESMLAQPAALDAIRQACGAALTAVDRACKTAAGACGCTEDDQMCKMRCSAGGVAPPASATVGAPAEEPAGGGGEEFNRAAAMSTLSSAANAARSCKEPDGPTGSGRARVTFGPTGRVESASVDPPFGGTPVGACVAAAFRSAHVPPFGGPPVTVSKSFSIK